MLRIEVDDMHTGGEPLRIVRAGVGGMPDVAGATVLDKRAYMKAHLDHVRRLLLNEPRGHADSYGCVIVDSSNPAAAFGVIFMHNEGYSTMCGHATIALGKYAVDRGLVPATIGTPDGEVTFAMDAPCGLVHVTVTITGTSPSGVRCCSAASLTSMRRCRGPQVASREACAL